MERNTKQKQIVYGALKELGHPSATEVYHCVKSEKISRATVFRVLGGFAESGKAIRLQFEGSDDRFDATTAPHAHARCALCGKIEDVPLSSDYNGILESGFRVTSVEVTLSGVCARCAKNA